MLDIEYSVITSDVIKSVDCMSISTSTRFWYLSNCRASKEIAQTNQSLHCWHTQSMDVDEVSDQSLVLYTGWICKHGHLTLYLIETHFNTSANRADPDQAALAYVMSY